MKNKKSSGRTNRAVSATNKSLNSKAQDEHLDPFSMRHELDVLDTQKLRDYEKGEDSVVDIAEQHLQGAIGAAGFPMVGSNDKLIYDYSALKATLDLRDNLCLEDGVWTQKRGSKWKSFISNERKKRAVYREASGSIRKMGQDKYSSPLKVIFVRLPPWLASELGNENDAAMVKIAVCNLAECFTKETGYPIIAANIHRENKHDLHVHLVYSDVVETPIVKRVTKKRQREILAGYRKDVREALKAEKLPAHSSDVKVHMDKMSITFPEFENTGKHEYRKIMRFAMSQDDWPDAKRRMNILGTAYRGKGLLWEAAKSKEDKETIREFREKNSYFNGSFSQRLCARKHLEEDYLDWWLEHEFYRRIYSKLGLKRKKRVNRSKRKSVENYIKYGKSVIDPTEIIRSRKVEGLDLREAAIQESEDQIKRRQSELDSDIRIANRKAKKTTEELESIEVALSKAREEVQKQKLDYESKFQAVEQRSVKIEQKESNLHDRSSSLDDREGQLNQAQQEYEIYEDAVHKFDGALVVKKEELADYEKSLKEREGERDQKDERLKKEARNEVLEALTAKLWPDEKKKKEGSAAKATSDRVANFFQKEAQNIKPKTLDQISSKLDKLLSDSSKFHRLAKAVRGFTDLIKKAKNLPIWLSRGCEKLIAIIDGTDSTQPKDTKTPEQ